MSVVVEFSDEEFAALYAALDPEGHYWRGVERLDWTAYDAAKARIAAVGRAHETAAAYHAARKAEPDYQGPGGLETWTMEYGGNESFDVREDKSTPLPHLKAEWDTDEGDK